jgi:hypothetical protein
MAAAAGAPAPHNPNGTRAGDVGYRSLFDAKGQEYIIPDDDLAAQLRHLLSPEGWLYVEDGKTINVDPEKEDPVIMFVLNATRINQRGGNPLLRYWDFKAPRRGFVQVDSSGGTESNYTPPDQREDKSGGTGATGSGKPIQNPALDKKKAEIEEYERELEIQLNEREFVLANLKAPGSAESNASLLRRLGKIQGNIDMLQYKKGEAEKELNMMVPGAVAEYKAPEPPKPPKVAYAKVDRPAPAAAAPDPSIYDDMPGLGPLILPSRAPIGQGKRKRRKLHGGNLADDIRNALNPNRIKDAIDASLRDTKQKLDQSIQNTGNVLGNAFDPNKNGLAAAVNAAGEKLKAVDWNDVKNKIGDGLDPAKNGVSEAFNRFGGDAKKAFEDIGNKIRESAQRDKEKLDRAFAPFVAEFTNPNSALAKFVQSAGIPISADEWKRKFEDPDTYFTILSVLVTAAASVASAGLAGPGVFAATQALIAGTRVITKAATGKPVSPMDIASVVTSMVPGAGGGAATSWLKVAQTAATNVATSAVKNAAKNVLKSNKDALIQTAQTLATMSHAATDDDAEQAPDGGEQAPSEAAAPPEPTPEEIAAAEEKERAEKAAAEEKERADQAAQQKYRDEEALREADAAGAAQANADQAKAEADEAQRASESQAAAAKAAETSTKTPLYFIDPAGGNWPNGWPKTLGIAETVAEYNARTGSKNGWPVKWGPFDPDAYSRGKREKYAIYDPDYVAPPPPPEEQAPPDEEMEGSGMPRMGLKFARMRYSATSARDPFYHLQVRAKKVGRTVRLSRLDPDFFEGADAAGLRGGSTILERGVAAELRELHPLVNREGLSAADWNASKAGKFNTLLNNVVHDKSGEPYDKEAMKLIKSVSRSGKFGEYGRAENVPGEMLQHNEVSKQQALASIDAIKSSKQKKINPPPAAVAAPPAPVEVAAPPPPEAEVQGNGKPDQQAKAEADAAAEAEAAAQAAAAAFMAQQQQQAQQAQALAQAQLLQGMPFAMPLPLGLPPHLAALQAQIMAVQQNPVAAQNAQNAANAAANAPAQGNGKPTLAEIASAMARGDAGARAARGERQLEGTEQRLERLSQAMFGKRAAELDDDENDQLDEAVQEQAGYREYDEAEDGEEITHLPVILKRKRTGVKGARRMERAKRFMQRLKRPAVLLQNEARHNALVQADKRNYNRAKAEQRDDSDYDVPSDEDDTDYEFDDDGEQPRFEPGTYFRRGGAMPYASLI